MSLPKEDPNIIRIFSFAGGGSKGYGSNRFMQKFLHQWGIPQADFWKYADVMCGTSIGGILACGYSFGKTPDELQSFFLEKSKRIFTTDSSIDSKRPSTFDKVTSIATSTIGDFITNATGGRIQGFSSEFYCSPSDTANFGHNILHQTLLETFGESTLANLHNYIAIPSFETDRNKFVVFSNFNDPSYFSGLDAKIVDVCRATSAAPVYLPSYSFNGHTYIDGGVYANDPVLAAINISKTVKPNARKIVIVDVGCGIGNMSFDGSTERLTTNNGIMAIFSLIKIGMTGSEEWTRYYLNYLSSRTDSDVYYYKFQPIFPSDFPNELDNSTAEWFTQLANLVDTHYANESANISSILSRLSV